MCGFLAEQNSDSYLASENIKRGISAEEAEEAEKGMEGMSEVYRETGEKLHLPEGRSSRQAVSANSGDFPF